MPPKQLPNQEIGVSVPDSETVTEDKKKHFTVREISYRFRESDEVPVVARGSWVCQVCHERPASCNQGVDSTIQSVP